MPKPLFMQSACLPLLTALGLGCSGVSQAVDDAVTIRVGAESLRAIEIERSMDLGVDRIPACLSFTATIASSNTTVALGDSPTGCTLTVEQPALVLLDDQAIERARQQSGDFDVNGIRGVTLDVQRVELSTAEGTPLALSKYVDRLTVTVDAELLLERVAASELESGSVSSELPEPTLEKLKRSLEDNREATADVGIALGLRDEGLVDLPDTFTLRVVMQPELQVNVIDAAL
jgi:hypothetical protein